MAASSPQDTLFLNATVIDGSGTTPRYTASVLIHDGFIQSIREGQDSYTPEELENLKATTKIITCTSPNSSLILSPGFIDMHAHSDLSLLHTPAHLAKITQGVTTEVVGQDGISYSPVDDAAMARIRQQIAGWNGNPDDPGFFDRWRSVREYLDVLDAERTATNVAYLVPQGNLRILVKGWDSSPATAEEIEQMKVLLAQAMEDGAVGMSSGLTYVPGMFATDEELGQLCEVVKRYGGYYCPHTRSYGKGALKAYWEMIELARKTGVRLHLTHATMNYEENAGRANELIAMIDEAIKDGVEISLDTYPYLPGSTTLASTLPSWAASAKDPAAVLDDPEQLAKIKQQALVEGTDGCHGCTLHWDILEIGGVRNASLISKYVGKTIAQIATEQNTDPFETYVKILKEDSFDSTILSHSGHEGNVRLIMQHPKHTGGSDGILTSTKPHPRGWGTFPRYLGHYARDLPRGTSRNIYHATSPSVFDTVEPETVFAGGLEEAVAHLTSRPASVIRAKDRGLVREGMRADLVVFDSEEVRDVATYADPKQPASGIRWVMVNGVCVVEEGVPNEGRTGRTVRLREEEGEWIVR